MSVNVVGSGGVYFSQQDGADDCLFSVCRRTGLCLRVTVDFGTGFPLWRSVAVFRTPQGHKLSCGVCLFAYSMWDITICRLTRFVVIVSLGPLERVVACPTGWVGVGFSTVFCWRLMGRSVSVGFVIVVCGEINLFASLHVDCHVFNRQGYYLLRWGLS